ncbi:MAG: methionine aminopeptidase, partial [Promethearchaeota archaeon CR_4]
MDADIRACYLKAGKAIAAALKKATEICKPGLKFLDFTTQVEQTIRNAGCGFGFPLNVSLDSLAAHYSSPIGD